MSFLGRPVSQASSQQRAPGQPQLHSPKPRSPAPPSAHDAVVAALLNTRPRTPRSTSTPPLASGRPGLPRSSSETGIPSITVGTSVPVSSLDDPHSAITQPPQPGASAVTRALGDHIEAILRVQEEIGRAHLQLENVGTVKRPGFGSGSGAARRSSHRSFRMDDKSEAGTSDAEESRSALARRQKGVEDIMAKLANLSTTLKAYHTLGTPTLDFPPATARSPDTPARTQRPQPPRVTIAHQAPSGKSGREGRDRRDDRAERDRGRDIAEGVSHSTQGGFLTPRVGFRSPRKPSMDDSDIRVGGRAFNPSPNGSERERPDGSRAGFDHSWRTREEFRSPISRKLAEPVRAEVPSGRKAAVAAPTRIAPVSSKAEVATEKGNRAPQPVLPLGSSQPATPTNANTNSARPGASSPRFTGGLVLSPVSSPEPRVPGLGTSPGSSGAPVSPVSTRSDTRVTGRTGPGVTFALPPRPTVTMDAVEIDTALSPVSVSSPPTTAPAVTGARPWRGKGREEGV